MALVGLGCGPEAVRLNHPPEAFAGYDRVVRLGESTFLDGSLSQDPDGEALSYSWRLLHKPAASLAVLEQKDSSQLTFTPDWPGNYLIGLQVSDGNYQANDLVALFVQASQTQTSTSPLAFQSTACRVVLNNPNHSDSCDLGTMGRHRIEIGPTSQSSHSEQLSWRLFRSPAGALESQLDLESSTSGRLRFNPPLPGVYWFVAQSPGALPSLVAVQVSEDQPGPLASLKGPAQGRISDRLLFDAHESSSSSDLRFELVLDPSQGGSSLRDQGTTCPPGRCRIFIAQEPGRYLVGVAVRSSFGYTTEFARFVEIQ